MPDPLISLIIAVLLTVIGLWLFRPERGLFWRWQRTRQRSERVLIEDALKHIYKCERDRRCPTVQSLSGALNITGNQTTEVLARLEALELVRTDSAKICLTPAGHDYALRIIRAHRLWERYLADQTGFDEVEWHDQADRFEHLLSPDEANALSAQLGNPTHDPHGDPIPTSSGEVVAHGGKPLNSMPLDAPVRIVHIEDEPDMVYAQLVAEGLHTGMIARLIEVTPQRVRFWAGGDEHLLAPIVAGNISVVPLPEEQPAEDIPGEALTNLNIGEKGEVLALSPRIRGAERRRLMDLGVLPGTVIEVEMVSPSGDPTAYRVRDALIALRGTQAEMIRINRIPEAAQ
jgi:DtxR family Mn-dependent transcriptional regulator